LPVISGRVAIRADEAPRPTSAVGVSFTSVLPWLPIFNMSTNPFGSTDDFGERTQRPTERRRREARARGDVARSVDLVAALVLLAAAASVWWLGPSLGTELAGMMRAALLTAPTEELTEQTAALQLFRVATRLSAVALPILLVIAAAAVVSNLLQTGFLWVPAAVLPRFERLDPAAGFSRWWAVHSWVALFWSLAKLTALIGTLLIYLRTRLSSAGPLAEGSPAVLFNLTVRLMGEFAVVLSLALVVLAIIDYGYQFWRQERQLMMTIEEVRREQRETEGNPQLKRRQRELAGSSTAPRAASHAVGGVEDVRPV
jgi:flagellar biosynthetic protein FlhB